ncbi:glycosyltransferase family 4 protein [Polaribacter litorisediminis]|uniref:glycosyltransferase family 4 protein n=1 Tax=Polaribacter litorisediminis TaxID=1908341 RepID=UPI001CC109DB|nr:glycosyltransferase family 4 protein [Polaribacter litorisediminis]UAM96599.1 glycosyltransferase family 4 protein [Polaribacter litorisediminis]
MKNIAFPHRPGSGGPGSFQVRFEKELEERGYNIIYSDSNITPDLIFIVGGTKKIFWLLKHKLKKVPIIFRLDGINWLHKIPGTKQRTFKNWITSTVINFLNKIIHALFANEIIYQSEFVRNWWDKKGFVKHKKFSIIYNGVDHNVFKSKHKYNDTFIPKIVFLEGNLDYSPYAIDLINEVYDVFKERVFLYGDILFEVERNKLNKKANYMGSVSKESLPDIYSGAIYVSLDVHPACPNTVIEALSCGAPVVGFDTGAISELVEHNNVGFVVSYGSNAWKLDSPDVISLINGIHEISNRFSYYANNAEKYANNKFSIQRMTDKYEEVINKVKK